MHQFLKLRLNSFHIRLLRPDSRCTIRAIVVQLFNTICDEMSNWNVAFPQRLQKPGRLFDRESFTLRSAPFGELHANDASVALVTAPSLGQTDVGSREQPGYLLARFEGGRLRAITRHPIAVARPAIVRKQSAAAETA